MIEKKIKLFCLPFSGANKYSYKNLSDYIAPFIDVVALELPGHGGRIDETLLYDIHPMVEDLYSAIEGLLVQPYAFYGHSLGTHLGYLLCRKILADKLPPPLHLFVSGNSAPSVRETSQDHLLPDNEFIEKLRKLGGIPEEGLNTSELMDFILPVLRADFEAMSTYQHQPTIPMNIPISVFIGHEEQISDAEIFGWQDETTQRIMVHRFPGGHFFIYYQWAPLAEIISKSLASHAI